MINSKLLKDFTGKNTSLEILEMICIEGSRAMATDMECYIEQKIEPTEVALCVPAKQLYESTRHLNQYEVAQEKSQLLVSGDSGTSTTQLYGVESSQFVAVPRVEGDTFEVNTHILLQALTVVQFSITPKNFSPVLTGVYLYCKDNVLKAVGTDSFRLCEYTVGAGDQEFAVVIPVTSAKKIVKALKLGGSTTKMTVSDSVIKFETGSYTVTTTLIQGTYPSYTGENIMPVTHDRSLKIDTKECKEALDRLFSISKDLNCFVEIEGNTISTDGDKGKAQEVLQSSEVSGVPNSVGLNGKYLYEFLGFADELELKFNEGGKPMRIDLDNIAYVIRPLVK